MIVLDEQLKDQYLIAEIAAWYPGTVTHIQALRPNTVIKDDNIATVLFSARTPTFVTINVNDFWQKMHPHSGYAIIAIDLAQNAVESLPNQLRELLSHPALRTHNLRMGKVIRVQPNQVRYYTRDRRVRFLNVD
ncbi:MAG: hypothetical protein R2911_33215 [Caldilineaceae bacterium]